MRVPRRIPTRDSLPSDATQAIAALTAEVAALRDATESEAERIAELIEALSARDARVTELERLLEDSRRSGKRQAAPFSKGDPAEEPKRPGRRSGRTTGAMVTVLSRSGRSTTNDRHRCRCAVLIAAEF